MNKSWPEEMLFEYYKNKETINNLLVHVILLSELKNDFSLGHFLTDKNGRIKITKDFMMNEIKRNELEFPMDYKGTLENCYGIKIIIENIDDLNDRKIRIEKYYPNDAKKFEELILKCSNANYLTKEFIYKFPLEKNEFKIEM